MTASLYRKQGEQFLDASGNPLAGAMLYYYRAGTTTLQDTYSDQGGVTPNTNPVVLNSAGRLATPVYVGSNYDYKELLTTSAGVTVSPWPADNIPKAQEQTALTGFERLYLPFTQVTNADSPVSLQTANAGDGYEIDATSGAVTLNLPAATAIETGTGYFFKRIDAAAYAVTVVPNGTDIIDGVNASIIVPAGYNGVYLVSDGAQWFCYAFHSPQARLVGAHQSVTASSSTLSINMNLGWHVSLTLSATVTTFNITNPAPSGSLSKLTLDITSTGAYNITDWPGTVIWTGGTAPTITSGNGKKDTIVLTSVDGGTNFRGYVASQNMS